MAGMILPSRPATPSSDTLKNDPQAAANYQQAMADYNFAIQCLKAAQDEENSTRANMLKSSHDALMNTIANFK